MDQILGNPEARWKPEMAGLVARSLMEIPDFRSRYRGRVGELVTNAFDPPRLTTQMDAWVSGLRTGLSAETFKALEREAKELRKRIIQRRDSLDQQLSIPDLALLHFTNGISAVTGWKAVDVPEGGAMREEPSVERGSVLKIEAGARTSASWRARTRGCPASRGGGDASTLMDLT